MMHVYHQVQQLRMRSLILGVQTILVFIASLFVTALLPSLLARFVLSPEVLLQQPVYLEYIPVVGFVLAIIYFVYAVVSIIGIERKAVTMEKSMTMDMSGMMTESEMVELEAMVDTAMSSKPKKKKVAKSSKKTAVKKSTKSRKK